MKEYLIDEQADDGGQLYIRDELLEEDLLLRKKLDDLELGLEKVNKELKPALLTMEKELDLVTGLVKSDKEHIEDLFDKLNQTWKAFSITCQALSEKLQIDIENPYFGEFVKETADEI